MVQATIGGSSVPAPDPTRARFEHVVNSFGKAWEAGKPAAMGELFTDDATFIPGPFEAPLKGRSAIVAYWSDVPREQSAISFRFGEIFVAGPWFATEFSCTYRRIKTGDWIRVSGALFCETVTEKISEMRMYWDRTAVRAP
ncbi:MAG: nuclear transport factor 2 family protein [Gemmatimonadetes bacterium]|nr:nuclear transport factor 2 family protein [Gemmatimonadota bacterium]